MAAKRFRFPRPKRRSTTPWVPLLALCLGAAGVGCTAELGPDSGSSDGLRSASRDDGLAGTETGNSGPGYDDEGNCVDVSLCQPAPLSGSLHLTRLTHAQWGQAARDIFELSEVPDVAETFAADSTSARFSTANQGLSIQETHYANYERGAEAVGELVAQQEVLDRIAPLRDRDAFLSHVGRRCYRRPLTDDEIERFGELFDLGAEVINSGDAFSDGAQMFARACLQSPHFLYRTELGEGLLGGYELASRLALSLWGSVPDDALLDAAESGELDTEDGIRTQVARLLEDPRAEHTVEEFHSELLHLSDYGDIIKDAGKFPAFTEETPGHLIEESQLFLSDVVFQSKGTYADVLTGAFTYVNDELARTYGLPGTFGPAFERVDLDPNERAGLLTHLGFLAKNSDAFKQDPIHRGVSAAVDFACIDIPPPPADIDIPDVVPGDTIREQVDNLTAAPGCRECHHTYINPVGFAFGNYDADGSFITNDAGHTIDASGELTLDGTLVHFESGVEFSQALAASEQVHRCYAGHLLQYFYGRNVEEGDAPRLAALAQDSLAGQASILDMIVRLAVSEDFRVRPTLN